MKLTAMVLVSLDGVCQGVGGPDDDRRFGFERGGWQAPSGDDEEGRFITSVCERMDAMLFGRLLLQHPDVLLLDEPTNQLTLSSSRSDTVSG